MAQPALVETPSSPAAGRAPPLIAIDTPQRHRWVFHRFGGLDQVALTSGEDLRQLENLDQKLWVALSCPTKGLELDARTLELLDTDRDGRVRAPEILEALRWSGARLRDLGQLIRGGEVLPLSALHDGTPEGRAVAAAARRILDRLGKQEADAIGVADVSETPKVWEGTVFNGDGIVPPEAAEDPEIARAIVDAVACMGGEADRGGKLGLTQARLDAFHEALAAHLAWWEEGDAAPGVMALGAGTVAAVEALRAVRAKVDDWFVRSQLAALDPRGATLLARSDAEYLALGARDLAAAASEVATFPLARVVPGGALPLGEGVNPAWAAAVAALRRDAVAPLLGEGVDALTRDAWGRLLAALGPADAWYGRKAGAAVEKLGRERVRALLAPGVKVGIEALLARDRALEPEAKAVSDVVQLVHYHRDLYRLLRNFVSFAELYDPRVPAVFQAGTLYLDGRSCELCIRVDDPAAHAALAASSRMFIAYCECRRAGAVTKVAACFTQGDSDFLAVGRNGVFYDRQGRDWDATIVRILDNPISIRQAFWSPYKKFVRLVEEGVARFAAAKEKASDERVASAATVTTAAATEGKAPAPVDVGKMVGIIAALGVGVGALGTVLGGLLTGFMSLEPWWAKPAAVAGTVLLVSGPSMLVAWLKLRQRTLGPVLDATGWAVNGRVRVNIPLGAALTEVRALPAGARRSVDDPFDDVAARRRRRALAFLAALVAVAAVLARHYGVWPFVRR
jgi:hypothetical protein